jgi:hypothetical protein
MVCPITVRESYVGETGKSMKAMDLALPPGDGLLSKISGEES